MWRRHAHVTLQGVAFPPCYSEAQDSTTVDHRARSAGAAAGQACTGFPHGYSFRHWLGSKRPPASVYGRRA